MLLTFFLRAWTLRQFCVWLRTLTENEILACARMKSANADEIFGFASDEIKSTHPPSRRISSNEVGFHRRRRFHPPARVDLVEKPTCRNKSVFLSMDYKKDIFAVFAYEFELSHKWYIAMRYDIRRCRMIYLLRKYDIISVPSYAEGIYHRS